MRDLALHKEFAPGGSCGQILSSQCRGLQYLVPTSGVNSCINRNVFDISAGRGNMDESLDLSSRSKPLNFLSVTCLEPSVRWNPSALLYDLRSGGDSKNKQRGPFTVKTKILVY